MIRGGGTAGLSFILVVSQAGDWQERYCWAQHQVCTGSRVVPIAQNSGDRSCFDQCVQQNRHCQNLDRLLTRYLMLATVSGPLHSGSSEVLHTWPGHGGQRPKHDWPEESAAS